MITFFEYINLILFGCVIVSGFRMLNYLHYRGKEKSAIYSFNALFIIDYIVLTKSETGKIGLWFKIFIASIILTVISGVGLEIYSFLN